MDPVMKISHVLMVIIEEVLLKFLIEMGFTVISTPTTISFEFLITDIINKSPSY